MADDLHRKPAADLGALIAAGELSPREILEACLARIEAENPALDALVAVCADEARRDADALTEEIAIAHQLEGALWPHERRWPDPAGAE